MKPFLFNPFNRIAGARALLLGWLLILLTAIIAFFSHCHFDGALDAHAGQKGAWWLYLAEPFLAWGSTVLVFYGTGLLVAGPQTRFVDIAGTMALSRWPKIFVALLFLIPVSVPQRASDVGLPLIAFGLSALVFSIWMIALMYHAYTVSCHVKGTKAVVSFILALVIAELISKSAFYFFYTSIIHP